ncbi:hypothetical protein J3A83DRAFT_2184930 [Scleroderma citrinum]
MATLNGSPIPVDELPMYYDYASAAQLSNQVYVAVSIVLLYEYFLTLDQEIDFIWRQRWTPSNVLYIFVRYFGTLYNLASSVLIFVPHSVSVSSNGLIVQPWAGSIIWWTVQVILQMRLYALYNCSKRLLIFLIVTFVAEIGTVMWILISSNLLMRGTIVMYHITFGMYGETDLCGGLVTTAYAYVWVPCLVFETILCLFAIYAGIKHSRGQLCRPVKSNRPRLIDVLIHGNVIYFLSPLGMFILLVMHSVSLKVQWLADTLLFRAPITILAGCRLILSIREAASSFRLRDSDSNFDQTTIAFVDRSHSSHA